jgi:predicted small lipoprotein YifL
LNFKFYPLLVSLLLFASCGKKGPPKVPADSILPSYEEHFINTNKIDKKNAEEEQAKKKNK